MLFAFFPLISSMHTMMSLADLPGPESFEKDDPVSIAAVPQIGPGLCRKPETQPG
jgi:hypothetical protein